MTSSSKKIS